MIKCVKLLLIMEIKWIRGSQISDELIKSAEKSFGIQLPKDLKEIIKSNNNARPSLRYFDSPKSIEHEFKKLLSFKEEDMENIYKAKKVLSSVDSTLFPIANDPAGNYICLQGGKIVYWLHETDDIEILANSFSEFLSKLY